MSRKTEMLKAEKNKKKKIIWSIIGILLLAFIIWVIILNKDSNNNDTNYTTSEVDGKTVYTIENESYIESEESNFVLIEVEKYGIMIAELYPDIAPITVKNFKKLVREGFYKDFLFHRVIKDFMIQTGDPTGTGSGGSSETITGEFEINGIQNDLPHIRGVLSMARAGATPETKETMNSASSQFFIVHKDSTYLDGNYAGFGKLLHGYDVLDKVATVQTDSTDRPIVNQVLKNIKFVKKYEGEK